MSELIGNAKIAADLAAAGFSVFPCHASGTDAKKPKPGVYWRNASTSDHVKVSGWWKRWPDAAVGLDLAKSGLIVIDADRHDADADGVEAMARLMDRHQFDPNGVPVVATPNQGTHFYFRQPEGEQLGNGRGSLPAGIDVRGAGGYVIAPGSVMADGRLYEGFGSVSEAPVLPDWLRTLIVAPKPERVASPVQVVARERPSDERIAAYVDAAISDEVDAVRSAPRGTRNHQLNRSAFALGQMVGAGWVSEAEVTSVLSNAAAGLAKDDGPASVAKTIRSGLRSGRAQPREMPDDGYQVTTVDYEASDRLLASFQAKERIDPETGEIIGEEITSEGQQFQGVAVALPQESVPKEIGGAEDTFDLPESQLRPGGVVEQLADWICEWTAEPIRIHAIGAALTIVGTLINRKVYSRTRPTSAVLYVGALAPSGMGKQHPQDCIRLALDEVCGHSNMHMGWNVSLPAIVVALQHQASKVMIADEFADKLIGIRSKNATTSQSAISEGLRSLWGTNVGTYSPDVSLNRGDSKIMRPALSFYGAATHRDFVRSLVSKDITNGLFNRFLILPRFEAIDPGPERDGIIGLPQGLKDRLQWMSNCLPPMDLTMATRGDGHPSNPILVPFSAEAQVADDENKAFQREMLIAADQDDALMLYGRYAEQIKRVAMIVACGRHAEDMARAEIGLQDMDFARTLVGYAIGQFVLMVRRDMVENWIEANRQKVLGTIRMAREIRRSELLRKVRNIKGKEIDEIIKLLDEAGCIAKFRVETAGREAICYRFLRD